MSSALIGYSGFVGSNIVRQNYFNSLYNSKNIESIIDQSFDVLVCSGAPAVKWLANKEPIKDLENINRLIKCLGKVSAQKVILISTVDVYPVAVEVDEDTEIDTNNLHPYGKHRLELERFVKERFDTLIVRLPGLFGEGLKKNIIYDFIHNNCTEQIHKDSVFQFYNLDHLWKDIQVFLKNDLKLVNLATEPIAVWEVASEGFGFTFTNEPSSKPARYDFRTKYSYLLDKNNHLYMYNKEQVLIDLKNFALKQIV
ncbi:NAD-dependent epimerase/dehydratase family protein [Coleofasciculus sp. FACHB-T130]|uniref:NAD-dependent epimerase/dehydratase family protein n=1 Tax=Cyanophyceae TaxID=3028117 RepID=UPI001689D9D6|nr:NAD-dependent epimerase/dehydratase family protein [Coleofasciculus sp. FACHB-T130]MBD1878308.1 pyridine nucleotide transhydrogenase [Coleofasciculus sp. FACHB-T130]